MLKNNNSISDVDLRNQYNRIFLESNFTLRDSDSFYKWILKKLRVKSGDNFLDIAFGLGHLIKHATRKGIHVTGIDFSFEACTKAKKIVTLSNICCADGHTLPFCPGIFNNISIIGSLEHFKDMEKALLEVKRVLNPGGIIAIFVPNSYYIIDIIWKVLRTGYGINHRQPLERFATINEWADYLEKNDLEIEKCYKFNFLFPISREDWHYYSHRIHRIILPIIGLFIPRNLSYSFLYICHVRK
jgi:ubiquinone/menaquinone biosynthesis C-methylase UbiE